MTVRHKAVLSYLLFVQLVKYLTNESSLTAHGVNNEKQVYECHRCIYEVHDVALKDYY